MPTLLYTVAWCVPHEARLLNTDTLSEIVDSALSEILDSALSEILDSALSEILDSAQAEMTQFLDS